MLNKILRPIDNILNLITMYRLMLYYLASLWGIGLIISFLKLLSFSAFDLIVTTALIFIVSWLTNRVFAKVFNVITNFESVYITAIILSLVITPNIDFKNLIFITLASFLSMSLKYILTIKKKHIFNPVAISIFIPSILTIGTATWWVGNQIMIFPVLIGGLLIIRKIQRFDLFFSFLGASAVSIFFFSFINHSDLSSKLIRIFLNTPILFFSFVMLTEPLTTPARRIYRILYGAVVGLLFSPQLHVLSLYSTPELSLIIGNIYSYLLNPRKKLILILKEKIQIAPTVYDFVFSLEDKFNFIPGQYLEWTLNTGMPDSRGNRRYFTIASSPTEKDLRIGVKAYPNASNFKRKLFSLQAGDKVTAGELSGDFIIPKKINQELIFIAGGIGITPFRSILKYLIDKNIKLPITIFYSNKNFEDIVYKDILDLAEKNLEIKTIYNLTDLESISSIWNGYRGRITPDIIKKEVPNFNNAKFYLSGPHSMVAGFEEVLNGMGVKQFNIKKDFFPGFV